MSIVGGAPRSFRRSIPFKTARRDRATVRPDAPGTGGTIGKGIAMKVSELFVYLRVRDAAAAVDFYRRALAAEELFRLVEPGGRIGHVELRVGPSTIMLSDEFPEYGIRAPAPDSPCHVAIHLHVDDADAAIARALDAGATLIRPAQDHFYGERSGAVRDPFGHEWMIGHHIEEVSTEEMQRRYDAMTSKD